MVTKKIIETTLEILDIENKQKPSEEVRVDSNNESMLTKKGNSNTLENSDEERNGENADVIKKNDKHIRHNFDRKKKDLDWLNNDHKSVKQNTFEKQNKFKDIMLEDFIVKKNTKINECYKQDEEQSIVCEHKNEVCTKATHEAILQQKIRDQKDYSEYPHDKQIDSNKYINNDTKNFNTYDNSDKNDYSKHIHDSNIIFDTCAYNQKHDSHNSKIEKSANDMTHQFNCETRLHEGENNEDEKIKNRYSNMLKNKRMQDNIPYGKYLNEIDRKLSTEINEKKKIREIETLEQIQMYNEKKKKLGVDKHKRKPDENLLDTYEEKLFCKLKKNTQKSEKDANDWYKNTTNNEDNVIRKTNMNVNDNIRKRTYEDDFDFCYENMKKQKYLSRKDEQKLVNNEKQNRQNTKTITFSDDKWNSYVTTKKDNNKIEADSEKNIERKLAESNETKSKCKSGKSTVQYKENRQEQEKDAYKTRIKMYTDAINDYKNSVLGKRNDRGYSMFDFSKRWHHKEHENVWHSKNDQEEHIKEYTDISKNKQYHISKELQKEFTMQELQYTINKNDICNKESKKTGKSDNNQKDEMSIKELYNCKNMRMNEFQKENVVDRINKGRMKLTHENEPKTQHKIKNVFDEMHNKLQIKNLQEQRKYMPTPRGYNAYESQDKQNLRYTNRYNDIGRRLENEYYTKKHIQPNLEQLLTDELNTKYNEEKRKREIENKKMYEAALGLLKLSKDLLDSCKNLK